MNVFYCVQYVSFHTMAYGNCFFFIFNFSPFFFGQPSVPPGVVPKACPNVAYAASPVLKCLLNDVSCHLLWLMAAGAEREGWTYLSVRC